MKPLFFLWIQNLHSQRVGGWGRPVACFGVQPTSFCPSGLRRPLAGGIRCISEDQTAPASFCSAGCCNRSQRANCEKALGRVRGSCRDERVVSVFNPPKSPSSVLSSCFVSQCLRSAGKPSRHLRSSPGQPGPQLPVDIPACPACAPVGNTHTHPAHTPHTSHTQAKLIY